MNRIFEEMFVRQPDEIKCGDYFYRIPWKEQEREKYGSRDWNESELEDFEKKSKATFMSDWGKRTFQGEFDKANDYGWLECIKGKNKDPQVEEIIHKIACDGIPFMDIASSEAMGLASYILKLNPKTPCLITDIDAHAMKRLRSRIGENLPEYNISIASFDNLEMTIKDSSIDCVTSFGGISASSTGKSVDTEIMSLEEFIDATNRKVLDEVYRILKPGGCFITVESASDWDYDRETIDAYFGEHEKLFGMYSSDAVRAKLWEFAEWREKYALNDEKIIASGFEVELEKRYIKKLPLDIAAQCLSLTGDPVTIEECDRTEDIITIYLQSILYILRKPL